ncbi:hypothetical protein [Paraburkholderia bryophila]|uniref:Uncharacterized protein n=1 Tax=Paraburkholderia bryophila TaxID=420952 RepID=A0A7Y9WIA6_9BURK|nr:hypothetical protein [Paraburkholderia bryophila]NYH21400.1 hypothetical protein [Paraburkholderia bryophila]
MINDQLQAQEKQEDPNQELHMFCLQWAEWHRSRRLFAPPIPPTILARLQPSRVGEPPNAILSADLSYFNLSLLSQPESTGKTAMYHFYIHRLRPIKLVAAEMGITTQGFYKAMRKARGEAYSSYRRMMGAPVEFSVSTHEFQV